MYMFRHAASNMGAPGTPGGLLGCPGGLPGGPWGAPRGPRWPQGPLAAPPWAGGPPRDPGEKLAPPRGAVKVGSVQICTVKPEEKQHPAIQAEGGSLERGRGNRLKSILNRLKSIS